MNEYRYSKIILYLSDFLSLLYIVDSFFNNSLFVIPTAFAVLLVSIVDLTDDINLKRIIAMFKAPQILKVILFICCSIILYLTSVIQIIKLFNLIIGDMHYVFILPLFITIILITGTIYGITYKFYESIYY